MRLAHSLWAIAKTIPKKEEIKKCVVSRVRERIQSEKSLRRTVTAV